MRFPRLILRILPMTLCATVSLHAGVNEPYKPNWANEDDIELLRQVFLDIPEHLSFVNPFKEFAAWRLAASQVHNPNAFKIYFPTPEKKKVAMSHWREKLTQKIDTLSQQIENHDAIYEQSLQSQIKQAQTILFAQAKNDRKAIDFYTKRLEGLEKDLLDIEKKKSDKQRLALKKERLVSLRVQLANPDLSRVIDAKAPELTTNFLKSQKERPVSVIVIDDFNKEPNGAKTHLDNPIFNNRILAEAINEGFSCNDHACHVAGIIARIAPFVKFIPKTMLGLSAVFDKTADDIIKNDYGAKIINISVHLADSNLAALKKLCQNHIVVLAAGNYSKYVPSWVDDALQDDNVRKHLLVVVNTMPDGETISPSSNIPARESKKITVAAPGTWTISALDLASQSVNPREGKFYQHWGLMTGTSQATPVVTALAATLMAKYPSLSLEQIVHIIKASARKTGELANESLFGNGLIDAQAAENMAKKILGL